MDRSYQRLTTDLTKVLQPVYDRLVFGTFQ